MRVYVQGRGGDVYGRFEIPDELPELSLAQALELQWQVLLPNGLAMVRSAPEEQLLILTGTRGERIVTASDMSPVVSAIHHFLSTRLAIV